MEKYDFVAIGDITTDAFIKLKDASVHCDINKENCQLCMKFGDKIPYESVDVIRAVGNASNASVSASRLGLKSALVANIGNDQNGDECLDVLKKENVSIDFITKHDNLSTNYHYVLWYEDERTILVKHEAFPYALPDINKPSWVYLSSLGSNSESFHEQIAKYLEENPEVKLAFQPGTFQMQLGVEKLKGIYNRTEVFFCNVEETKRILSVTGDASIKDLLAGIRALGPKIAVITDGPRGAYCSSDAESFFVPPYPDKRPPFERTGAGDAFASTVISAIALGKSLGEALLWGPINSASVVQDIGAQRGLLTRGKLEAFLEGAPADYKTSAI